MAATKLLRMMKFPLQKLLALNSWLKLQIFEEEVPKKLLQGCPMAHMPRNEGETSHQTALAGKREGIRQFPSKICDQIRMHQSKVNKRFDMVPGYFLGTSFSKICSFNREFKAKSFLWRQIYHS